MQLIVSRADFMHALDTDIEHPKILGIKYWQILGKMTQ
jgi:hypothetical protein